MWTTQLNQTEIRLIEGDITDQPTDAIVNASNPHLMLGGGVAGAIRRRGGPRIQEECNKIGGSPVGTAVITTGGNLSAKYVIHAVGPIWGQQSEDRSKQLLQSAIKASLEIAIKTGIRTITFPAISTGIYGFPKELAAQIMAETFNQYAQEQNGITLIQVCLFGSEDYELFKRVFQSYPFSK